MTNYLSPLTTQEQDEVRQILCDHLRQWLANSLPSPYTQLSKADAIIVVALAAQKFESEITQESLQEIL